MKITAKDLRKMIREALNESLSTEIYYHGGDASHNLWHNGVLWLTPQDYYAKTYAKDPHNKKPIIYKIKINESKLKPANLYYFSDDFDPYQGPEREEIPAILADGYNCYFMDYDSYDAEGLCLLSKEPIISIRPLTQKEYDSIEDVE